MTVKDSIQDLISEYAAMMSQLFTLRDRLANEPALYDRAGFAEFDGMGRLRVTAFANSASDGAIQFRHLCMGKKMFASGVNRVGECDGWVLTVAPVNQTVEQVLNEQGMTLGATNGQ